MIKSYDAADSLQLQNVYIDETLLDSAVQVSISHNNSEGNIGYHLYGLSFRQAC